MRGYFETRSLGFRTLRGITEPVELLQVLGPSTAQTRLEASARRTRLVGRERADDDPLVQVKGLGSADERVLEPGGQLSTGKKGGVNISWR